MQGDVQRYHSESELRESLKRIGEYLRYPADVYLIGGAVMVIDGVKESTKDIDMVTPDEQSFRRVNAALDEAGYVEGTDQIHEVAGYDVTSREPTSLEQPGAFHQFRNDDDNDLFDVYDRKMSMKITLSESMIARSNKLLSHEELTVFRLSPTDLALVKLNSGKSDHYEEARDVIRMCADQFDWETLSDEFESQLPYNTGDAEYTMMAVEDTAHPVHLLERGVNACDGVPQSFRQTVERLADIVETEYALLRVADQHEGLSRSELEDVGVRQFDFDDERVNRAIDRLARKDVVEFDDGTVQVTAELLGSA